MKKSLMLLAAVALFATTPAFAAKGDKWIGIGGGASIPMSDMGDLVGTGWNGTAFFAFGMAPKVDLGVDVGYHKWTGKNDVSTPAGPVDLSGLDLSAIQATPFVKYHLGSGTGKAAPYLKGGLGLYNLKEKFDAANVDESTSKFGFNVGGGVDWTVSPMYTVGINAAYHMIKLDDADKYPNKDGSGYNPSLVTVGAQLAWGMGKK